MAFLKEFRKGCFSCNFITIYQMYSDWDKINFFVIFDKYNLYMKPQVDIFVVNLLFHILYVVLFILHNIFYYLESHKKMYSSTVLWFFKTTATAQFFN